MIREQRPDPDRLLERIRDSEEATGQLKVFLGMAAGVGKTYAMLEEAHARQAEGVDVMVGWVETHGRGGTAALLEGLLVLPPREDSYRDTTIREFDLDGALTRRPEILLLDELAHTNADGSRHPKRWQDVLELLDANINVYTTVNVQHIETLNDVVAQITGVVVRETVPDKVLDRANQIELIDLTPDGLLERLREGKVYGSQQASRALQNFFRKGNLIALRELALRTTAERVDAQMRRYKDDHAITTLWPAGERVMVCVGPSPSSARLVRSTSRMATSLRADWIAVYVETPQALQLPDAQQAQVVQTLRLAEQLGAEAVTLSGTNASEAVLAYARTHNVSRIVVGKPARSRWYEAVFGSFANEIVRRSGEIDVHFITGEGDAATSHVLPTYTQGHNWGGYLWAMAMVAACTSVARLLFPLIGQTNVVLMYLLGVVAIAMRFRRRVSFVATVLSVATFNFFFTTPYFSFDINNPQYVITFTVMLLVALIISSLTIQVREQAEAAHSRERRTASLYAMSRDFAALRGSERIMHAAKKHMGTVFGSDVSIFVPGERGQVVGLDDSSGFSESERAVAQWSYEHGKSAGQQTDTLPGAEGLYLPLIATNSVVGVVGVRLAQHRGLAPEQMQLLETFVNQTALAVERAMLAAEAEHAHVSVETERMRTSLLSSVSHDLRTPLASITGAASSLIEDNLDQTTRYELYQAIYHEAERLNRLVNNLLEMTRIELGSIQVQREWQPLEEVVGAALHRMDRHMQQYPIRTDIPADLPLVPIDGVLIEQVFINLLDNARKYTPDGTPITISGSVTTIVAGKSAVCVSVCDRGPGLAPGSEQQIFDKFVRAPSSRAAGGAGLGLAICKGIVDAHGGEIRAENQPSGGACFAFTLPLDGETPAPLVAESEEDER